MPRQIAFGVRCTASDDLGNRCVKDGSHLGSGTGVERWHDASRGPIVRRWE